LVKGRRKYLGNRIRQQKSSDLLSIKFLPHGTWRLSGGPGYREKVSNDNRRRNQRRRKTMKPALPSKLCIVCLRPMTWRKKWAKNWADVKYCSAACRRAKDAAAAKGKT
jgi:hypothetical protein